MLEKEDVIIFYKDEDEVIQNTVGTRNSHRRELLEEPVTMEDYKKGPVEEIHYQNGDYEILANGVTYSGKWKSTNNQICYKQRDKANIISHMELIGDVEGKNVILVDDMVDTAGTLTKAAELLCKI